MNKRSLTLIETLIALVLVLALGALVFPSMMRGLEERSFESAVDVTNEQLMLARAHAQATGTPVEVTYNADKSQVLARLFLPFSASLDLNGQSQMAADGVAQSSTIKPAQSLIDEAWARQDVGRSVRFLPRPPARETGHGELPIEPADDVETIEDLLKGQEVRLAVFMPDGSALTGDKVWLNDDKGRIGVFTINPWNGLPLFQRLADLGQSVADMAERSAAVPTPGPALPGSKAGDKKVK